MLLRHRGTSSRIRHSTFFSLLLLAAGTVILTAPALPQGPPPPPPPPPVYSPAQLDNLVARIALYPDSLLSQVLAAATYPDQIPEAAAWANQHNYLRGDDLARAIQDDQLPWDPSVQALLPFPTVLDMMSRDMAWTSDLGNAFLAQQQQVMDAVQRMRQQAWNYGYLRSNSQVVVNRSGPYVEIVPVNPAYVYVPVYNPVVVFARPRPGFAIHAAISFGPAVTVGPAFHPWGWGANHFAWSSHTVIINNRPWTRTWNNRVTYVHPYSVRRYTAPHHVEHHDLREHRPPEHGRPRDRRDH